IWLSDADEEAQSLHKDLDEPLHILARKLERKLAQTRVDVATARVLIVSTWMTGQVHRVPPETMDRFRNRLFRKHNEVVGVLLAMHTSRREPPRHYYEVAPILPEGDETLLGELLEKMQQLERDHSVPTLVPQPRGGKRSLLGT